MNTLDLGESILHKKGYHPIQVTSNIYTLEDNTYMSCKFIILYNYSLKNQTGKEISFKGRIGHGFFLTKQNGILYRIDSWEGIHPFIAEEVPATWLETFYTFLEGIRATGKLRTNDFIQLFGTWKTEQEELQKKGEYVNEYPRDMHLEHQSIQLHRKVWSR